MKIVHVSTHDVWGGAAIAAHRLHTGLRAIGEESTMFVANRTGDGRGVLAFDPPRDFGSRLVRTLRRKSLARELSRYAKSRPDDTELFSDDRSQPGPRFAKCRLAISSICIGFRNFWIADRCLIGSPAASRLSGHCTT